MTITPRYGQALLWAEELHRKQRRKGKPVPYISHLIAVSALVWEDGGTEDQAIAGLLHDAIEDAEPELTPQLQSALALMWPTSCAIAPTPTAHHSPVAPRSPGCFAKPATSPH